MSILNLGMYANNFFLFQKILVFLHFVYKNCYFSNLFQAMKKYSLWMKNMVKYGFSDKVTFVFKINFSLQYHNLQK